jgi:broad specificity phosphatase PhoE
MDREPAQVYLIRHGETEWSAQGRHTGRTDLPLTERGERDAARLREKICSEHFFRVLTSPLERARRTCELAGLADHAEVEPDIQEWDYGRYDGRRTAEIRVERPNWNLFRDGCPGGESLEEVAVRADRVLALLRRAEGPIALFSHGHFLRVLAARWLRLPAIEARRFLLGAAAICILGHEHGSLEEPAVVLWNDARHAAAP